MKASSNKEFEQGIYGSFTVASVVVDSDVGRHDYLMVGVNVSDHLYLPLLVYHTGAVVVQVSVKSLAQCHDVPAEALEDPLYIVMSTDPATSSRTSLILPKAARTRRARTSPSPSSPRRT